MVQWPFCMFVTTDCCMWLSGDKLCIPILRLKKQNKKHFIGLCKASYVQASQNNTSLFYLWFGTAQAQVKKKTGDNANKMSWLLFSPCDGWIKAGQIHTSCLEGEMVGMPHRMSKQSSVICPLQRYWCRLGVHFCWLILPTHDWNLVLSCRGNLWGSKWFIT